MNIAIIDDDIDFIQALRHEVEKYMESRQIEYTIDTYKDSQYPELLDKIQASEYYDLFLLDIQMTAINGLDLAHEIQMKYIEPTFLFITNFYRYAMECYVYSAVRYILKVDYVKKLPEVLDACIKKIYQIKVREERKIIPGISLDQVTHSSGSTFTSWKSNSVIYDGIKWGLLI